MRDQRKIYAKSLSHIITLQETLGDKCIFPKKYDFLKVFSKRDDLEDSFQMPVYFPKDSSNYISSNNLSEMNIGDTVYNKTEEYIIIQMGNFKVLCIDKKSFDKKPSVFGNRIEVMYDGRPDVKAFLPTITIEKNNGR